uniref:VWFA domain-containing protein n=1 Tax=Prolemur simus TaxID=1328070 RepID=A0A8C8Z3W5_PROSS
MSLGVPKAGHCQALGLRGRAARPGTGSHAAGRGAVRREEAPSPKHLSRSSPGLASSPCFNLDTEQPTTFRVDSAGFGHGVVQSAHSWVVVGAPQEIKAGGLHQCDYSTGSCEPLCLQVSPEAVNMSLGLSLAAATSPSQMLVSRPGSQEGPEGRSGDGGCWGWGLGPRTQRTPRTTLSECPRQKHDIVFLIGGSGSISSDNFAVMNNSVRSQFQRPSPRVLPHFSLMQFSSTFRTRFMFNDFIHRSPHSHSHPDSPCGFARRLWVLFSPDRNQPFTASNGGRKDKLGDCLDHRDVIPEAEAAGVIRYAIGMTPPHTHTLIASCQGNCPRAQKAQPLSSCCRRTREPFPELPDAV